MSLKQLQTKQKDFLKWVYIHKSCTLHAYDLNTISEAINRDKYYSGPCGGNLFNQLRVTFKVTYETFKYKE